ncbi:MAG TPA: hypothetical protein VIJ20_12095 [Solirubrobacteraceae bacterium]
MIIVLALLVIGLLIAVAGLTEALSSSTYANRDARVRRAQQAADAGVQTQLYQQNEGNIDNYDLNGGPLGLTTTLDCVVPQFSLGVVTGLVNVAASSAGACPQSDTGGVPSTTPVQSPLGDHAYEESETFLNATTPFSGAAREFSPVVVSLGSDTTGTSTVYSREEAALAPVGPLQTIEGMGNVTVNGALGLAATVNGDVYARGSLTLPLGLVGANLSTNGQSLLATIAASSFSGGAVTVANKVTVTPSQMIERPPITIASTKADCPTAGCPTVTNKVGSDGYSSATDTFTMTNSSETVIFQPGDYVFCNFNVTAGTVEANPTAATPVRIFIDSSSSSRCKNDGLGTNQGNFNDATGMDNLLEPANPTGATTAPSGVQVYVVGDENSSNTYDNATTVNVGNQSTSLLSLSPVTQAMVIYAPTSAVTMNTGVCVTLPIVGKTCAGGVFDGSIIGDNVTITATTITQDLDLGNYPLYNGVNVFHAQQYVECSTSNSSGTPVTTLTGTQSTDTSGC